MTEFGIRNYIVKLPFLCLYHKPMVSLYQICKQTNKSSWARLAASASRTSREVVCWVCELADGKLQESQEHRIVLWHWPTLWWSKPFYLQIFPLFVFLGQCCLLTDVGTASLRTMGFKWLYVLLEYGFLCFLCSNQPFRYGERLISLFITFLWKEKRKKTTQQA